MEEPYACPICGRRFVVPSIKRDHMKKEHNSEEVSQWMM